MSKKYKIKHNKEEIEEVVNEDELSKKELYDLNKKKKLREKEKLSKKNDSKKKKKKSTYKTNLLGRIFAIVMLILMIGSVIATISYSFNR